MISESGGAHSDNKLPEEAGKGGEERRDEERRGEEIALVSATGVVFVGFINYSSTCLPQRMVKLELFAPT